MFNSAFNVNQNHKTASFGVAIPTVGEKRSILKTLKKLENQGFPAVFVRNNTAEPLITSTKAGAQSAKSRLKGAILVGKNDIQSYLSGIQQLEISDVNAAKFARGRGIASTSDKNVGQTLNILDIAHGKRPVPAVDVLPLVNGKNPLGTGQIHRGEQNGVKFIARA